MNHTIRQRKTLHHGLIMIDQKHRPTEYTITVCDRRYFLALAAVIFISALLG